MVVGLVCNLFRLARFIKSEIYMMSKPAKTSDIKSTDVAASFVPIVFVASTVIPL